MRAHALLTAHALTPLSLQRFKVTGTGLVLRMRVGKRHCASAKSQPQRTRLRQKAVVHESRAYVMRKLGFSFAGSSRA